MKIYYTLFAESPSGELSEGVNQSIVQSGAYYSLYAFDNSGLISDEIVLRVVYVLKNYTLYNEHNDEFSFPVSDKCIVRPMQVPRNLRILREFTTHDSMKITWDNVEGMVKYGVYVKNLETGVSWKTDVDENNYILTNLRPDNSYEIRVASHIQYDFYSELSEAVIGTTLPGYFGEVDVNVTIDSINLSWENVPGAEYYRVYYGMPGDLLETNYSIFAVNAQGQPSDPVGLELNLSRAFDILASSADEFNRISFTATELDVDTQYLFYLVAVNDGNEPITATSVYATTLAIAPAAPDPFTYIIKEITAHSITIAWSPAARARYYRIHLNNNPEPQINHIFYPEVKINKLLADTIYTITIVSVNSGGETAARPFAVRTAKGEGILSPGAPRPIYPNCDQITAGLDPSFYWRTPNTRSNIPPRNIEFAVEIASNRDFVRPQWNFSSADNKTGFSYSEPQPGGSKTTLNYRMQKTLTTNNKLKLDD